MDAALSFENRRLGTMLALTGPAAVLPVFLLFTRPSPSGAATFGQWLALATTWVAAVTDLKYGKIFNWCTYPACAWGLAIALAGAADERIAHRLGALQLGACLGGLAACLIAMLVVHSLTGGGMGDVKLAGALGSLLGATVGLHAILLTFVTAGVAVLGLSLARHGLATTVLAFAKAYAPFVLPPGWRPALRPTERSLLERRVRLGPFFAAGSALALVASWYGPGGPSTVLAAGSHP
jgi:prepilin signal peptidase PulO-like enzyme (type II secretory pathway)